MSSCVYTAQQTVVVHFIETASTLLIRTHIQLRFWIDVILTTSYQINRMHFAEQQSLLYTLFKTTFVSSFSTSVKSVPILSKISSQKITRWSLSNVSSWYSHLQKYYKFYDPIHISTCLSLCNLLLEFPVLLTKFPISKHHLQCFPLQLFQLFSHSSSSYSRRPR